jgi:energy-coupling factor transport system ATP-binding protein
VALLGRNGAGKTTLARLAIALLQPTAGTVEVNGVSTAGRRPEDLAAHAGYLFQHPDRQLFARTALDEAAFAPRQLGRGEREARETARAALDRVGLAAAAATHPLDLAPADRKLLALAAAIAQAPALYLLDEPTQGFDRPTLTRVGTLLREEAAVGRAAMVVTHDLGFVAEWCDRAVLLAHGRVAHDAPSDAFVRDVVEAPRDGLVAPVQARLGAALDPRGRPVRAADVIRALRLRCPPSERGVSSPDVPC